MAKKKIFVFSGRLDEWVIIELQGVLESAVGGDLSGKDIGTLSYTNDAS